MDFWAPIRFKNPDPLPFQLDFVGSEFQRRADVSAQLLLRLLEFIARWDAGHRAVIFHPHDNGAAIGVRHRRQ